MRYSLTIALAVAIGCAPCVQAMDEAFLSHGRAPDSTAKILSELREADRRRIPIEVALKARSKYKLLEPMPITITITNLFDPPLLLNSRMLVNHRRLPGELSFTIVDPQGRRCEFQRLISPMEPRQEDFVLLARGMSIQRSIDLADFFDMHKKGIYKIQVSYRNDIDQMANGQHPWMGIVSSDVTEVELR